MIDEPTYLGKWVLAITKEITNNFLATLAHLVPMFFQWTGWARVSSLKSRHHVN